MLTPPSDCGGFFALEATATPVAKWVPKIVIILPGARVELLTSDAAFTTLVICALELRANAPARQTTGSILPALDKNFHMIPPAGVA
jgi:hypothetical protein